MYTAGLKLVGFPVEAPSFIAPERGGRTTGPSGTNPATHRRKLSDAGGGGIKRERRFPGDFVCGTVLTSFPRQCISLESLAGELRFHVSLYGPTIDLHSLPRNFCRWVNGGISFRSSNAAVRESVSSCKINRA